MKTKLLVQTLAFFVVFQGYTQVADQTGFESWPDEHEYLKSSWESDGFSLPWVNGFNASRGYVDNAYSVTGTKSLRITYPSGTYGPGPNGAQAPLQVPPKDQYYVSYWVRFSDNFDWGGTSEGGKLPGLAGGGNCSGCSFCTGSNGFSARLMWRPSGRAVLYLYHMDKAGACGDNINLLDKDGNIIYFAKGAWYNIIERVKVNSGSNYDGEVEIWVNGDQALLQTGIRFVTNGDKVSNFYFSTFHGGSSSAWAPGATCYTWFDDIIIAEDAASVFPSLPVELKTFTGEKTSKGIHLKWITASETNNKHFAVERSINGIDFTSIGKISGHGTSNEDHLYFYTDESLLNHSVIYYRLAQYDLDEKVHYSSMIKVDNSNATERPTPIVSFQPNPFSEYITVFSNYTEEDASLRIFDLSGKKILQISIQKEYTFGDKLLPGMYLIEVTNRSGKYVGRIIKH